MSVRHFAVLAAAALLAGNAPPGGIEFGNVTEIASPAPPGSSVPNLALGPGGRAYMSWIELQSDSAPVLRFATLAGTAWSEPRAIATGAKGGWFVNWADFPSVMPVDDNTLAAHWLVRSGAGRYAYDVYVARSSDAGHSWTTPAVLHRDRSESEHGFVSMVGLPEGVGAVWLDGRKHAAAASETEGEMTLQYATLDARGAPTGEVELDGRVCDCCQTAAALTSEGPIVVYRDRSPAEVRDIAVVRRVHGRWTAPRLVHADNWVIPACPVNGPAVSARGKYVVVAWFTGANDRPRVNVAFSRNAGRTFGRPIRVDDGEPAGRVAVQLSADGTALVSWLERAGQSAEVRVKEVGSRGRTSRAKTVAVSSGERASGFPRMIYRGRDIVFAWTVPGRPSHVKTAILELTRS